MIRRLRFRALAPGMVALTVVLYLPRLLLGDARLGALLPAFFPVTRLAAVGSVAKVLSLAVGAVFGLLVGARLERGNPARAPWLLIGLWLGGFAVGQAVLSGYVLLLDREPPLPSIGDAGFLVGYALMLVALSRFVIVYRASGFPVGSAKEHLALTAAATLILTIASIPVLRPIVLADVPLRERMINVAYPILDFAGLVPTLVMLRISRAFRGGKVGSVWAALLSGLLLMAVGDILFAYLSSVKITGLGPAADAMFLLGYFFASGGTMLQYELLTEG